jgi:hypothetical protein
VAPIATGMATLKKDNCPQTRPIVLGKNPQIEYSDDFRSARTMAMFRHDHVSNITIKYIKSK